MKITAISDLHGHYPKLEGGDLLIIAGDLTANDEPEQYEEFFEWLSKQKYQKKIFICGNHDNQSMSQFDWFDAEYLCDSGTEFEGFKIWGSPWTTKFKGINPICCAFTVDTDEELNEKWDLIPDDVDIFITHSPPYGILDGIPIEDGSLFHVGSKSLLKKIKKIKPSLVICGHIHEFGLKYKKENDIFFINSSLIDERYKPRNGYIQCQYQNSLFTPYLIQTHMK